MAIFASGSLPFLTVSIAMRDLKLETFSLPPAACMCLLIISSAVGFDFFWPKAAMRPDKRSAPKTSAIQTRFIKGSSKEHDKNQRDANLRQRVTKHFWPVGSADWLRLSYVGVSDFTI